MTQSLHAIVWYLFIILLPNLMRAMHVYLTSTSSMCKTRKLEFQWHATQCLSLFQYVGASMKPCGTCGGVVATSLCGLIIVTCCWFQKNVLVHSKPHWRYMHEARCARTPHMHSFPRTHTWVHGRMQFCTKIHPM